MSEQYHKDIHRDCFKLRCLLTNHCNQRCTYCLNDFQDHKEPVEFIDSKNMLSTIRAYVEFCKEKRIPAEVYFSGGEPTEHPYFNQLALDTHRIRPDKFVLCTNGTHMTTGSIVYALFTELHISIHHPVGVISQLQKLLIKVIQLVGEAKDSNIESRLKQVVISGVFNPDVSPHHYSNPRNVDGLEGEHFFNMWHFLHKEKAGRALRDHLKTLNIEVQFKVWAMYQRAHDEKYMLLYNNFLKQNKWILNRGKNFVPHNRGKFCQGCTKDCVTLKALWLFPDNTASGCPQDSHRLPINDVNNKTHILKAYEGHLTVGKGERDMSIPQKRTHEIFIEWIEAEDPIAEGTLRQGRGIRYHTDSDNPLKSYIDTHVSNGFLIITEPSTDDEVDTEPIAIPVSHVVAMSLEDEE